MFGIRPSQRGFTLIELMVAVAVAAILAAIALPAYTSYVQRSRVPKELDALSAYAVRMEQYYQDTGSYAGATDPSVCGVALPPVTSENFTISCQLKADAKGFTAFVTGSGPLTRYDYSIDDEGTRKTADHPIARPTQDCWSIRGGICDA